MRKQKAGRMVVSVGILALSLAGCAPRQDKAPLATASVPAQPNFTVQTPIDQIAANKDGKAVLEHDVPGLMADPHYVLFSCMSLAQMASLSGGRLDKAKLALVNRDLAAIPHCAD